MCTSVDYVIVTLSARRAFIFSINLMTETKLNVEKIARYRYKINTSLHNIENKSNCD